MKGRHISGVALFVLILLASSCKQQTINRTEDGVLFLGSDEASDVVERVVAPGARSIELSGFAGSVHLAATDDDVASFMITRSTRGDSPQQARDNLNGLDIEEVGDETRYRYNFKAENKVMSRYDVIGTVPTATPVRIRWASGEIRIEGLAGHIDVQNQHGDVEYSGAAASVKIRTRNGGIAARFESADPSANYVLATANGDADAEVRSDASLHIEASTSAGTINTGPMLFASEEYAPMDAGASFKGRLGQGTGRLTITTHHGSIDLLPFVYVPPAVTAPDSAATPTDTLAAPGEPAVSTPDTAVATVDSVASSSVPVDSLR